MSSMVIAAIFLDDRWIWSSDFLKWSIPGLSFPLFLSVLKSFEIINVHYKGSGCGSGVVERHLAMA